MTGDLSTINLAKIYPQAWLCVANVFDTFHRCEYVEPSLILIRVLACRISNEDRYIRSLSETLEFLLSKFSFSLRPEQLLRVALEP